MKTRLRPFLGLAGAILLLSAGAPCGRASQLLDPTSIPKYVEPLVIPPVMPPVNQTPSLTRYRIAVRQFEQQILPARFPATTVWGYGREGDPLPGPGVA